MAENGKKVENIMCLNFEKLPKLIVDMTFRGSIWKVYIIYKYGLYIHIYKLLNSDFIKFIIGFACFWKIIDCFGLNFEKVCSQF